ncbi:MAG TPA: hypothetical protein VFB13_05870 [Reyranella sp.]|jgi:hypothetical protein|nr:hypothetical protein [Reyranella sp.]
MTEPDDGLGRNELDTSQVASATDDARLARLEEQERIWLLWVSRLHEHHARAGTEESRIVLEIAKRRWLAAKTALANYLARQH